MYYCPGCEEEFDAELSEILEFQCLICYGELEEN